MYCMFHIINGKMYENKVKRRHGIENSDNVRSGCGRGGFLREVRGE